MFASSVCEAREYLRRSASLIEDNCLSSSGFNDTAAIEDTSTVDRTALCLQVVGFRMQSFDKVAHAHEVSLVAADDMDSLHEVSSTLSASESDEWSSLSEESSGCGGDLMRGGLRPALMFESRSLFVAFIMFKGDDIVLCFPCVSVVCL